MSKPLLEPSIHLCRGLQCENEPLIYALWELYLASWIANGEGMGMTNLSRWRNAIAGVGEVVSESREGKST